MEKPKPGEAKILIAGDFCPHKRIEELALKGNYESVFNDFIDEFRGHDLTIVDFECPLTASEKARRKTGPHQKSHPETISILNYAGVNLVVLANNHIMDYDNDGIAETLELCRKNGIDTTGVGRSREEAALPYSKMINGRKIAVLNYADNEFLSTPDGSYTCNPIDYVRCYYDIKKISKEHDFLIVIVHGGNEFYELPSPRTKELYRYMIDLGADIVLSHHTHVFSGYEIYNSKPIFYGLGNLVYDWPGKINEKWNRGYLVRLNISSKLKFEIVPYKQCGEKPGLFHLGDNETVLFNKEISRLNSIIDNDDLLEKEFQSYCESVSPMYRAFIEPYFGRVITALQKRGLLPRMFTRKKILLHLNLSRCESHRDVLLRMLKKYE